MLSISMRPSAGNCKGHQKIAESRSIKEQWKMQHYLWKVWHKASKMLEGNWNENYKITIPAHKLYPYQWSWDSAFIAIGNSYLNVNRAITEFENFFLRSGRMVCSRR